MEKVNLKNQARLKIKNNRKNLRNQLNALKGLERKSDRLSAILETLPKKIHARMNIEFNYSATFMWVTVRPLYKRFTENDTMLITDWCAGLEKWRFSKNVDSSSGTWNHNLYRRIGYNSYEIEFVTTSNIDGCKLIEKEVTETRKVYEVEC